MPDVGVAHVTPTDGVCVAALIPSTCLIVDPLLGEGAPYDLGMVMWRSLHER